MGRFWRNAAAMPDMEVKFKVDGLRSLERMLLELGPVPASRVGTNAVRAGARVIAKRLRQNIAAKGLIESGRMLRTVGVKDDRRASFSGGSIRRAFVGATSFLLRFHEFGTGPRYHKKTGKFVGRLPARATLRPALDEGAQEALDAMALNMGKSIEREALRLAKKYGVGK